MSPILRLHDDGRGSELPLVPAQAGTQSQLQFSLDSRLRGNERVG